MKKFLAEFKEFALKGNVLDMAVGVVIGGAFTTLVNSLVANFFTPIISLISNSGEAFSSWTIGPIQIGLFINDVISFIILAFCVFLLVKFVNLFRQKKEAQAKAAVAEEKAKPTQEEILLTEIRDLLKAQQK
jgi:large conductance mechanosensitive channel